MTKYEIAFKREYNRQYALAVEELGSTEGMDEGVLITCHAMAGYKAARQVAECKCHGTGTVTVRNQGGSEQLTADGRVITWHEETCYGCGGKGFQTPDDQKRNWGYWAFYARIGE